MWVWGDSGWWWRLQLISTMHTPSILIRNPSCVVVFLFNNANQAFSWENRVMFCQNFTFCEYTYYFIPVGCGTHPQCGIAEIDAMTHTH